MVAQPGDYPLDDGFLVDQRLGGLVASQLRQDAQRVLVALPSVAGVVSTELPQQIAHRGQMLQVVGNLAKSTGDGVVDVVLVTASKYARRCPVHVVAVTGEDD
jgi:hypothetical protein